VATAPTVKLPHGAEMPVVGFGTWQMTGSRAYDAVRYALDAGYRHLDTATMYRNEDQIGRAMRDSGLRREDVFITTKLLPGRAGRARETIAASLRALDSAYVDLWLIHWPPRGATSTQTWEQLLAVREEGLAREVGVSNYSTAQLDELIAATGEAPAVNQIPWSPGRYDASTLAESRERGVVVEGYSPIKGTDLRNRVLVDIAAVHRVSPVQVVLRWHLEHDIVVIPKSARPDRIRANFDLFGFSLSPDEVARIDALAR
jgi:2,5-diketo-D-gluconate reductase A